MKIVVCLSRDRTFFSNMTYLADGGGFTHASLGLDTEAEYYYSFNFKGMKKEYRTSLKKRPRQMTRYIIDVPDDAGNKLKRILEEMEAQKENYQYAKLGVSLRLFHLPNENPEEDKYFCSQFVAAVLKASGCVDIKTAPETCTPNDLLRELKASGQICAEESESELVNPGEAAIDKASDQIAKGHDRLRQTADHSLAEALDGNGKLIPSVALALGLSQLDPLYEKLKDKLEFAGDAVGDSPAKLARLTSGLLESGSGKLLDAKEALEQTVNGNRPVMDKKERDNKKRDSKKEESKKEDRKKKDNKEKKRSKKKKQEKKAKRED